MTRTRRLTLGLAAALLVLALHSAADAQEAPGGADNGGQVIGGDDADIADHPYIVAVLETPPGATNPYNSYICSGVVISPSVVLTAGSCVTNGSTNGLVQPSRLQIMQGRGQLYQAPNTVPNPPGVVRNVDRVGRANGWTNAAIDQNDLGFLHLATPLPTNTVIDRATVLDEAVAAPESLAVLLGWGAEFVSDQGAPGYPLLLQQAQLEVAEDAVCGEAHPTFDSSTDLCAGAEDARPCYRDGGGPLVTLIDEEPVLIGLSHAPALPCPETDDPQPYVEVSSFEDTIDAHVNGPSFSDVNWGHPFYTEVEWMFAEGISTGNPGTPKPSYKPNDAVTRQAMSAFLYRLRGLPAFPDPAVASFSDVSTTHPFFTEIEWMKAEGITTGNPGTPKPSYKPNDAVSRQAMSAFMYRVAGQPAFSDPAVTSFSDVSTTHPFFTEIEWMFDEGVTTGNPGTPKPSYKPNDAVSRQAMSAFMYRLQPLLESPVEE